MGEACRLLLSAVTARLFKAHSQHACQERGSIQARKGVNLLRGVTLGVLWLGVGDRETGHTGTRGACGGGGGRAGRRSTSTSAAFKLAATNNTISYGTMITNTTTTLITGTAKAAVDASIKSHGHEATVPSGATRAIPASGAREPPPSPGTA